MLNAIEELKAQLDLLRTEWKEDLSQYENYMHNSSLQQRKAQGICWYPVEIKETGYGLGDYPYVVVERPSGRELPHQFQGGKAASIFTNRQGAEEEPVNGTIHFVTDNTMKIILYADDFPEWLDGGRIGVNLLFDERSYREMEKGLKAVSSAEKGRLAELREIILGYKPARFERLKNPLLIPGLNPSQNEAVNTILEAKDVAVIHGPPGTGKTTTLVHAISALAKYEKNILVCAPSNAAVDLLTERLSGQGLDVIRIGNISRIDENILAHTLEGRLANHPETKNIKKIKRQAEEYRRMALKYKRQFGKAEREQRNLLLKEARKLSADAVQVENELIRDLLDNAHVITATLVGVANRYTEDRMFNTLFIDEAAQALEPACWIPVVKANRVILAGDPFQLPPTIKSAEAQKKGFNVTLIEKCLQRLPDVRLLNVQYRMHEAIMGFSNKQFYEGALQAHPSVARQLLSLPENLPLEFIDTAGCSYDEKMNPESQSFYNPGEWQVLKTHLHTILLGADPEALPQIGIISPYREQLRYMETDIEAGIKLPVPAIRLDVNTIDSFQGQERDVIYISLVRSNEKGEIGFLHDYRRMNVAMTRARMKLVVIGDSATLGSHAFYRDFLEYVENKGSYRSAWEYIT